MTFEDLPDRWPDLPLTTTPLAADVVDLVLACADRVRNALLVLPCDDEHRSLPTPIVIRDVPWHESPTTIRRLIQALAEHGVPAVIVAISAPTVLPMATAVRWFHELDDACDDEGVTVLGRFVADLDDVTPVPAELVDTLEAA